MTKQYTTLKGLKRAAIKHKRATGCRHSFALETVAQEAGFADYHAACLSLGEKTEVDPPIIPGLTTGRRVSVDGVEILEMSPELAALLKHQRDLDIAEAGPQAPEPIIDYRGVIVSSRYAIAHELETMSKIVDALPDGARDRIDTIWCDSKACACYNVTIKAGKWVEGIAELIRECTLSVANGFNTLVVEDDTHHVWFDPEWEGDDYNYNYPGEEANG